MSTESTPVVDFVRFRVYTVGMGDSELATWLGNVRERLRSARLAKELSHRAAGERSGVPFRTITRIELGAGVPSLDVLWKLCAAYGVPLCEVLCEPQPAPKKPRARAKKGGV